VLDISPSLRNSDIACKRDKSTWACAGHGSAAAAPAMSGAPRPTKLGCNSTWGRGSAAVSQQLGRASGANVLSASRIRPTHARQRAARPDGRDRWSWSSQRVPHRRRVASTCAHGRREASAVRQSERCDQSATYLIRTSGLAGGVQVHCSPSSRPTSTRQMRRSAFGEQTLGRAAYSQHRQGLLEVAAESKPPRWFSRAKQPCESRTRS
jgi:hypothetical protein